MSLAFEGAEAGMMDMMMGESGLANGAPFDVMTFAVGQAATGVQLTLPETLLPIEAMAASAASNAAAPRTFVFAMDDAMNWTINGRSFEMDVVAEDEQVRFGDAEIWEFANLMEAPDAAAGGAIAGMNPVSYTHLDVYKRQRHRTLSLDYQRRARTGDRSAQRLDVPRGNSLL